MIAYINKERLSCEELYIQMIIACGGNKIKFQ